MILSERTLQELCELINEITDYRTGPQLVRYFNDLGFNDSYGQGFPSRKSYTTDRLQRINGTPEIDKCIKKLFAPINYVNRLSELVSFVEDFNKYLTFDGWEVTIKGKAIEIRRCSEPDIESQIKQAKCNESISEDEFIKREIKVDCNALPISDQLKPIISSRIEEISFCFSSKAYLSSIIMAGSVLEAVLLGVASNNPKSFNQSQRAPKDRNCKVKQFQEWSLASFIDVANDLGIIKEDVFKFSHVLRSFRNFIHPYQQMLIDFYPDEHTSKICLQVMKAALWQIVEFYAK